MRWAKHLLAELGILLLFIPLLMLIALLWAIATEQGSRWTIAQLNALPEVPVKFINFQGRLIDTAHCDALIFTQPQLSVEANDVDLQYNLLALLQKKLTIQSLTAKQLSIRRVPTQTPRTAASGLARLHAPHWPVQLEIRDASIEHIVYLDTPKQLYLNDVQFSAGMQADTVSVEQISLRQANNRFEGYGQLQLRPYLPFEINVKAHLGDWLEIPSLFATGNLQHYRYLGSYRFQRSGLPPAEGQAQGQGDLQHVTIEQLIANTLDGQLSASGAFHWDKTPRGLLQFVAANLDVQRYRNELRGRVSGQGLWVLEAKKSSLNLETVGQLQGLPLSSTVEAIFENGVLQLQAANLRSGDNQLTLQGELAGRDIRALDIQANLPQLQQLEPALTGALTGTLQVEGSLHNPQVTADLQAQQLALTNGPRIDQLTLNLQPLPSQQHRLLLKAEQTHWRDRKINHIELALQGDLQTQTAQLQVRDAPGGTTAQLAAAGFYTKNNRQWQGQINTFDLTAAQLPHYRLRAPAAVRFSPTQQYLAPLCLQHAQEALCLSAELAAQQHQLDAEFKHIPMQRFSPWLPALGDLPDRIDLSLRVQGQQDRLPFQFTARIDADNYLQSTGQYNHQTQQITADLQGGFAHFDWLALFTDEIEQPHGRLSLQAQLSGPLDAPKVQGNVQLDHLQAKLPATGTALEQGKLNLQLHNSQQGELSGSIQSGPGTVALQGQLDWPTLQDWQLKITATGKRFEAINQPLAQVLISPDLSVTATRKGLRATGTVRIPEARIELARIPESAVPVSKDEYIVGAQPSKKTAMYPTSSAITFILGDKIRLVGNGLDARLTGKLKITQSRLKQITADGVLNVAEGSFTAYGQNLSLDFGQIYFNGPLKAARLNLLATRKIDNITAGIRIVGTLDAPESHVFAIPMMPPTDALAYLLTGKPLEATGQNESKMLINAAVRLGLKGSAGVINDIRSFAKLDTLEIQPAEDLAASALIIGKYLSPNLYLEYATQLFENSDVITIHYDISKKLQLEAKSSDTSKSIDLIYQFEKN